MGGDRRRLVDAIEGASACLTGTPESVIFVKRRAELAELVDALDSGSSVSNDIRVQVPGSASRNFCSMSARLIVELA